MILTPWRAGSARCAPPRPWWRRSKTKACSSGTSRGSPDTSASRSRRSGGPSPERGRRTGAAAADHRRSPTTRACSWSGRRSSSRSSHPILAGPVFDAVDQAFYTPRAASGDPAGDRASPAGRPRAWPGRAGSTRCATAAPTSPSQMLVLELAVEPVRVDHEPDSAYLNVVLARLQLAGLKQRIEDVKSKLQRINPVTRKRGVSQQVRRSARPGAALTGAQGAGGRRVVSVQTISPRGSCRRRTGPPSTRTSGCWRGRMTSSDQAVIATNLGLWWGGARTRWHEISKAKWDGTVLSVITSKVVESREGYDVIVDEPPVRMMLEDPEPSAASGSPSGDGLGAASTAVLPGGVAGSRSTRTGEGWLVVDRPLRAWGGPATSAEVIAEHRRRSSRKPIGELSERPSRPPA